MRQIPQHQRALGLRRGGDGVQVVHPAGAVVHMRQHHDRDVVHDRARHLVGGRQVQFMAAAEMPDKTFGDVQIGREILSLRKNDTARRIEGERRSQHLKQVDRTGVAGDGLARAGADQPAKLVADALMQVDPAMDVPARDQIAAPFVERPVDARPRRLRHGAQ
jgi:hypothetical protein